MSRLESRSLLLSRPSCTRSALLVLLMAFAGATLAACAGEISDGPSDPETVDAESPADSGAPNVADATDAADAPVLHTTDGERADGEGDAPKAATDAATDALACTSPADIIIRDAKSHLGQPYVWGAEGPCKAGYDCSGLVWAVFKETGYFSIIGGGSARTVPQIAAVFRAKGLEDMDTTKLPNPGDLITFGAYAHIGIYIGQKNQKGTFNAKGWIVNALNETAGVVENKVDALIPGVHSYLHTGLSGLPCTPTAFTPPACL